jgi:preprotein translocase subunit SecG
MTMVIMVFWLVLCIGLVVVVIDEVKKWHARN